MRIKQIKSFIGVILILFGFLSCNKNNSPKNISIAVFVPGIMADSATYRNLAQGVTEGVSQFNNEHSTDSKVNLEVFEAGTNQTEWLSKLTSIVATTKYDVVISSNPSLPELCIPLTEQFPKQKFILLDSMTENNMNISTISYNQKEQAYLSGFFAGLISKTHKVGLIAGQEYPVMNNILFPYYKCGAEDAFSETETYFRVVGNWYDATKGSEITNALCSIGVDFVVPICGGASQGVISSAKANNIHIGWFDENGFNKAEGIILSSCKVKQDLVAKEAVLEYLNGQTIWGTAKTVGFAEDYIEFIQDDPLYINNVPEVIQVQMKALIDGIKTGIVSIPELN